MVKGDIKMQVIHPAISERRMECLSVAWFVVWIVSSLRQSVLKSKPNLVCPREMGKNEKIDS